MINVIESIFFNNFIKKIFLKGEKSKYLKIIFLCWKYFKKKKFKPNLLLTFILLKLKPLVNVIKQPGPKKRRFFRPKYYPLMLDHFKGCKISVNWFLIPLLLKKKKKEKLEISLQRCFYIFLNKKRKNLSIVRKKNIYLKILKNKRLFRYK